MPSSAASEPVLVRKRLTSTSMRSVMSSYLAMRSSSTVRSAALFSTSRSRTMPIMRWQSWANFTTSLRASSRLSSGVSGITGSSMYSRRYSSSGALRLGTMRVVTRSIHGMKLMRSAVLSTLKAMCR